MRLTRPSLPLALVPALLISLASFTAGAQTLRIGLAEDPDALDPTTARWKAEYLGRTYYFCAPGCKKAFTPESS